jgi:epoxyqueuosine reductase
MTDAKATVQNFLKSYNVEIVGFGRLPDQASILEIEEPLPRAIVFGYILSKSVLATIKDQPTLLYKHHYKTVNWLLDQTGYHLARFIEQQDKRAVAIPASQLVDWDLHKGHISHRHLARAAGLGHVGRSGLLIHPVYGAQVRYTSVLTDLEFEPDKPTSTTCDPCMKCIAACPAHAISRDGMDIHRCYEQLTRFASIRGIGQHICGVCVKVCNGEH